MTIRTIASISEPTRVDGVVPRIVNFKPLVRARVAAQGSGEIGD